MGIRRLRFNLLSILKDRFCRFSNQLELLKRERTTLEGRLNDAYPEARYDIVSCFSLIATGEYC